MNRRFLPLLVILAAVVASEASIAGQAPAVPAASGMRPSDAGILPVGPDGHPSLQGVWLNNSATPLERPKLLEGRQSLTNEEVAELKRRAARQFDAGVNSDFAGGGKFFPALLTQSPREPNPESTRRAHAVIV